MKHGTASSWTSHSTTGGVRLSGLLGYFRPFSLAVGPSVLSTILQSQAVGVKSTDVAFTRRLDPGDKGAETKYGRRRFERGGGGGGGEGGGGTTG